MQQQTWTRQGSAKDPYVIQLREDGRLSCNCQGWTMKRAGKPRACKHTTEIAGTFARWEQRDDGQYVLDAGAYTFEGSVHPTPSKVIPAEVTPTAGSLADTAQAQKLYRPLMLAAAMPDFKTVDDYADEDWLMEQKFDGERVLAVVRSGAVFAFSRIQRGHDVGLPKDLGPYVTGALLQLPDGTYDGEIVVGQGRSNDVRRLSNADARTLVLFDALELMGSDVTNETYDTRRMLLRQAAAGAQVGGILQISQAEPPSQTLLDAIWEAGGEGVMLKRRLARYVGRRSDDWLKVKRHDEIEATIIGFDEGLTGPKSVVVFRLDDGVEGRAKVLNADWHRAIAAGTIKVGTRIEVAYQVRMESGKLRHPMAKRVLK